MDPEIYAYRLVGGLPVFVVMLVAAALCVKCWGTERRTAVLLGTAVLFLLAARVVAPLVSTWAFQHFFQDLHVLEWRIILDGLIFSVPDAIAWGVLLWMIFKKPTPRTGQAGPSTAN